MKTLIDQIETFKQNEEIMKFVTKEALEKTAADIREKHKGGTTALAVQLLMITNPKVEKRVNEYIASGLIGCLMASA